MSARPNPLADDDWRAVAGVTVYLAAFLTALAVATAWWGASGTGDVRHQIAWLNLGVGALVIGVTVGLGAVVQVRRRVAAQLVMLADRLERLHPPAIPEPASAPTRHPAESGPVTGDGMRHYHRSTCMLVRGKPVSAAGPDDLERAGRRPCAICQP